jgi:hypothetical protein
MLAQPRRHERATYEGLTGVGRGPLHATRAASVDVGRAHGGQYGRAGLHRRVDQGSVRSPGVLAVDRRRPAREVVVGRAIRWRPAGLARQRGQPFRAEAVDAP